MTSRQAPAIHEQRLRQLLRKLVDIYSPSGKEEDVLDFLHGYLKRHNLPVIRQNVDGYRYNLLVMPPETEIRLALIGHVDTVAAYDLDRFGYEEQGDLAIGLGSADMKAGCAAMVEAYLAFLESDRTRRPPVALAFVVGEEEEGDGIKRLVKEYHFPWALIGEPTDLQPCLSHYGYLEVQITTRGKRMHASLANLGQNPIETLLRLILRISHYIETQRPDVVYNIRDLTSSQSGFAVPDWCDAWIDFHLPPTAPADEITLEIEELLARERQASPEFNGTLRFTTIHTGYRLPEKGAMVEAIKKVLVNRSLKWEPGAFPSHSDANLLWAAGVKPMLFGPGRLEKAHAPDESVSFSQVSLAAQIYLDLLVALTSSQE